MGVFYTDNFESQISNDSIFVCHKCNTQICLKSLVISDKFYGNSGPAYLVDYTINVSLGKQHESNMRTGTFMVRPISCIQCWSNLGWKYDKSFSLSESYKENKFVIEKNKLRLINLTKFFKNYYSSSPSNGVIPDKTQIHYNTTQFAETSEEEDNLSDDCSDCESEKY